MLVSIDGLRPDYVVGDAPRARAPNLRQFVTGGTYATGVRGVVPTVTYPSHATLITGVSPAEHGVLNNHYPEPTRTTRRWYWSARALRTESLWSAASQAGLTTANIQWPGSVDLDVDQNVPAIWGVAPEVFQTMSSPGLVPDDFVADDGSRVAIFERLYARDRPDFVTLYIGAVDTAAHAHGPFAPETLAAVEQADMLIARIRDAAHDAVICVVSDHGMAQASSYVRVNSAFRKAGLIDVDDEGQITKWRAFLWSTAGMGALMVADGDDQAADQATAIARQLAADPTSGIESVLSPNDPALEGSFADAVAVLVARPGFVFATSAKGDALVSEAGSIGAHGYPPQGRDMDGAFFLLGPHVPRGRDLGRIDMIDVAPTIAHILAIPLPTARGRNVL